MVVNRTALVLSVAAAATLLGGCGKKVGGQVVAVVDGQEVTQGEVNAELGGQQIPAGADRKAVMGQIVSTIVNRKLLVDKAKQQGLDKSPTYLGQVQRAEDAVLINMLAANLAKTLPVPDAAAVDAFIARNPSLFGGRKRYQLQQVVFTPTNDPALAAKLKAAKTMADVTAALKSSNIAYDSATGTLDTASIPPAAAAQIAALSPGEAFLAPSGNRMVANVITATEPLPVPADQARPAALELLRRQAVEQAMRKQVETARASAKITYSPDVTPPKPGAAPAAPAAPAAAASPTAS